MAANKKFEYAPAPESRAIVDLQPSYGLFINGAFVDPVDGHSFKTISPATEEVLAEVSDAGQVDVDRAGLGRGRVLEGGHDGSPVARVSRR